MSERPKVSELIDSTVEKMRSVADADTIIGETITLSENVTAVPILKISYGFAAGGSDFATKNTTNRPSNFGGGGGGGMTVTPVAFLICKNDDVKVLNISEAGSGNAGVAAIIPELFDKVVALYNDSKKKKAKKAETEKENEQK